MTMKKKLNHLGINEGKIKCIAAIKDNKGKILNEFFFCNDEQGVKDLFSKLRSKETSVIQGVLEFADHMWMRIHS